MSAAAPDRSTPTARRASDASLAALRRNAGRSGCSGSSRCCSCSPELIQPSYGATGIQGLAISVLPLALAAVAQAIVVISGGIDLSIGVDDGPDQRRRRRPDEGPGEEFGIAVAIGVLLLGVLLGAINGALIVLTRVADIVVTLAMSFVWAGCALLVLKTPGGGCRSGSRTRRSARSATSGCPRPPSSCSSSWRVVWIPLRRSRLGLSHLRHRQQPAGRLPERRPGRPHEDPRVRARRAVRGARRARAHRDHRHRDAAPRAVHADERRRRRPRRRQPGRRSGRRVRSDRRASSSSR